MKILGFYITRTAPREVELTGVRMVDNFSRFNEKGELIVPRKKAGEVFDLLTQMFIVARKEGGKPKKERQHPSRIVEPIHQEIKKLYGIVAAKKDAEQ